MTKEESRLLWPWAPGLRCLNNDKVSLSWRMIRNVLRIARRLFTAQLATSPEWIRYGDMKQSAAHAFFLCLVLHPLYKLLETSWFACCLASSLSWKPVLFVAMWFRHRIVRNSVSLLTWHYESCDLDNTIGEILRKRVLLISDVRCFLQAPD